MHDRINHVLTGLLPAPRAITSDKRLVEDLGFDSLKIMDLVALLEDEFGITISLRELWGVKTVRDVYSYLERSVSAGEGVPL
jgi:acyl carrier protein